MLTRISYPPEPVKAPRRAIKSLSFIFDHFQDHDGRPSLSIWMQSEPKPPPLYSFQVYITSELAPAQTSDREALGKELFGIILADNNRVFKRLDIHLMHPGEGPTHLMKSHRAMVQAKYADFAKVVVPSYACSGICGYSSLLFVVSDPDWKQAGLKGLFFDPVAYDPEALAEPVSEDVWTKREICDFVHYVYNCWELREAYEDLFSEGEEAGMTEWQEILNSANRLGMLQV
ncbi:hypothetical protein IWX49DRAFT_625827 [Phyllosticta citricarpa]|uniref:Uncharacterized protein n=2 Tax=Phyllosticta TaxID=121621 RepID=A0ABR1MP47_9PEZI